MRYQHKILTAMKREVARTLRDLDGRPLFLFTDGTWGYCEDYEPEKRWHDVTAECQSCDRDIKHNGVSLICPDGYLLSYYRFRKVQLAWPERLTDKHWPGDYQWAFLIEKEE